MPYYTLIASLPHLPAHFDVERAPISRRQLEQRLTLLRPEHAGLLTTFTDFLAWDRQTTERTDEDVVREYRGLQRRVSTPLVMQLIDHRIDLRTIVGALRRRRDGAGPPIGVGRLVETIRRNWQHPQFNLQRRHPWIEGFSADVAQRNAVAAERRLYEVTWQTWCRIAAHYTFSFEAVLLYTARWSIVDRWTTRSWEAGRERFENLVEEALGDYLKLEV